MPESTRIDTAGSLDARIRPAATIVDAPAFDDPHRTVEVEAYEICAPSDT